MKKTIIRMIGIMVILMTFLTTALAVSAEETSKITGTAENITSETSDFAKEYNLYWKEATKIFEKVREKGRITKFEIFKLKRIERRYQQLLLQTEDDYFKAGWGFNFVKEIPNARDFEDLGGLKYESRKIHIENEYIQTGDIKVLLYQNFIKDDSGDLIIDQPSYDAVLLVYSTEGEYTLYVLKGSGNKPLIGLFSVLSLILTMIAFSLPNKGGKFDKGIKVVTIVSSLLFTIASFATLALIVQLEG